MKKESAMPVCEVVPGTKYPLCPATAMEEPRTCLSLSRM